MNRMKILFRGVIMYCVRKTGDGTVSKSRLIIKRVKRQD